MLIFRGGAVSRDDVSPSVLQAHVEKWYRWSDELARQGRRNVGTALDNGGRAVGGHERVVTDGPYAESKDLVTGAMIIDARGATRWSFRLPKLPRGRYVIRTRAVDFAGNVQVPHARRLRLR
jgi:hypothetical protein